MVEPTVADNTALIGGLVGGVGGALVAGAVVLIVLAALGKLKKRDDEELNKDVENGVYGPIGGTESHKASRVVEMRKYIP